MKFGEKFSLIICIGLSLSGNIINKIKQEKNIYMKALQSLSLCPLHSIFLIRFSYILRKVFKRKYNCLIKHTILSHILPYHIFIKKTFRTDLNNVLCRHQRINLSLQKQSNKKCEMSYSEILIQFQQFLSCLF